MRKGVYASIVAAAALFGLGTNAGASIVYNYVTGASSYNVGPNGTVTVPIYLQETLTGSSTSLIIADGGLFAGGFSVTRSGTLPSSPATLTSIAGSVTTNGSSFTGGTFVQDPQNQTSGFVAGDNLSNFTSSSGPMPNSSGLIELGTVTIQAGSSGTTDFTLANYSYPAQTGGYTTTFGNGPGASTGGFDLDVSQSGANAYTGASATPETFAVNVTSVPEPASLGGLAAAAGLLLSRRRARRA